MSRQRIFDHLDGAPEDRRFSRVARAMRVGMLGPGEHGPLTWWQTTPERDEPAACSGEVEARGVGARKVGAGE